MALVGALECGADGWVPIDEGVPRCSCAGGQDKNEVGLFPSMAMTPWHMWAYFIKVRSEIVRCSEVGRTVPQQQINQRRNKIVTGALT
jgi:hypothetical protein